MLYFKNSDLAETHHVSLRTVLNWIEAAKKGKLDLLLHEHNGKSYVANTTRNIATIEAFVEERRKYRNTKSFKVIEPSPKFYELYNEAQILDIISNLDIYKEIPLQYTYFNDGATDWDKYANRLDKEIGPNLLNSTRKLLKINEPYLDYLLSSYKKVNIIDLGVGNALPVKEFIENLLSKNTMGKYVAIDISKDMIKIARTNIERWFGGSVAVESHEMDFTYKNFSELLALEYITSKEKDMVNVVLLLGGTMANLRNPDRIFRVLHDSMGKKDVFVSSLKLDTANSRRYFDFDDEPDKTRLSLSKLFRFVPDLLGIDESLYEVETSFDKAIQQRSIRIRLKVALSINFKFDSGERLLDFHKDDAILLWRSWHQNALGVINQLDKNEFSTLQTSQTEDKEYMLTISKIKC